MWWTMRLWTCLTLLFCANLALAQTQYDILLKNGHVIDPRNNIDRVVDVAITGGTIALLADDIAAHTARRVVDCTGRFITPGLIDIHVHVYAGTGRADAYNGDNSVYPDGHTFPSGVTTVVDAGSSGWVDFPDFKDHVIDRAKTRVLAFLNIVGNGMTLGPIEQNAKDMEPEPTAARAREYPGLIVGIKSAHWREPNWICVDRALEAARLANLPLMVDFGVFTDARPFQLLVTKKLRRGDIYTHTYLRWVPMLDSDGNVEQYLFDAQKRGVIFDVGHGGGSFSFRQAVPATRGGFWPNSISTDLHIGSMNSGMKSMINVMSKFLNLGMSIQDVVQKSTWNPARQIRREDLGHLSVGAVADVAVIAMEKGDFGFIDVEGGRLDGTRRLHVELTLKDGRVMYDLNGIAASHWTDTPLTP